LSQPVFPRLIFTMSDPSQPIVSVLLPVYNGFPYLPKTIESVLAQTEKRWVMYALNDGSSDESEAYLNSLDDPRIIPVHHENQGLSKTLNDGLELCQTRYIARLDADDECLPERFEKQIAFLDAHPQVGLLGSQVHRMGTVRSDTGSHLPTDHESIMQALTTGQHAICHPSIMCRKEAFDQVGGYKPCIGEDWDMYLRFGENWKLANHPECLLRYRYHGGSINGAKMGELRKRIRYHCETYRLRMANLPEISYEEFVQSEQQHGFVRKMLQKTEDISRAKYHSAVADILGEHPIRGYARLGTAALSAPQLTIMRLLRKFGGGKSNVA